MYEAAYPVPIVGQHDCEPVPTLGLHRMLLMPVWLRIEPFRRAFEGNLQVGSADPEGELESIGPISDPPPSPGTRLKLYIPLYNNYKTVMSDVTRKVAQQCFHFHFFIGFSVIREFSEISAGFFFQLLW